MQAEGGDTTQRARALEAALDEALAGVHDGGTAPPLDTDAYRWLGIGMRLGLERPVHARRLLEMVETRDAGPAAPPEGDDGGVAAAEGGAAEHRQDDAPAASLFLARSAAFSPPERAGLEPDVVFGWAAELAPTQVLRIGRVVIAMLAEGVPADVGRGFGLAWDGGARIPGRDRDAMFREFTELEAAVAGVLAGRDLRTAGPEQRPHGFGAFAQLFGTRPQEGQSTVAAAIDAAGEPGRRGLVALWNTWMAMRYRPAIPATTFELLTRPWVTVVGPLPDR